MRIAVILQVLAPPVPPAATTAVTPLSQRHHLQKNFAAAALQASSLLGSRALMWMTHPQVPLLPPCFANVTITL